MVCFLKLMYLILSSINYIDPFDYKTNGENGTEINLDVFNDHLKTLEN